MRRFQDRRALSGKVGFGRQSRSPITACVRAVPLRHDPGHAQVDFGEALAVIGGVERKIHFFAMDLPHSDAGFVQAYSVPTAYGHREVVIRGYVEEVVISCGAEIIARHARSYEREDFVFDPLHYLALLERKIGALDQAAPLAGWQLPQAFATLRRLLEARMGKQGKREFVQVLRLMEVFRIDDVAAGVRDAIDRGVIGFDAAKHLVLCRIERRLPRLDMTVYPYLPHANVATTSARTYMDLLAGVTS